MKRVAFLGSKEIGFECLKFLIENQQALNIKLVAVLSNEKPNALGSSHSLSKLAEGICPILKHPDELVTLNEKIDVLISVQYHLILKEKHLKTAKDIAVNLHMAPLPEYRGCNQFSFAIIDQKSEFGTTLHEMLPGVDNGPILFESRFEINSEKLHVQDLYKKTFDASVDLFRDKIKNIIDGNFNRIPQETLIKERGTSFHLRKEIDDIKKIPLEWPAEKIYRYFRATYFPPFAPPVGIEGDKEIPLTRDFIDNLLTTEKSTQ